MNISYVACLMIVYRGCRGLKLDQIIYQDQARMHMSKTLRRLRAQYAHSELSSDRAEC